MMRKRPKDESVQTDKRGAAQQIDRSELPASRNENRRPKRYYGAPYPVKEVNNG